MNYLNRMFNVYCLDISPTINSMFAQDETTSNAECNWKGDLEIFQGKWILQWYFSMPSHLHAPRYSQYYHVRHGLDSRIYIECVEI